MKALYVVSNSTMKRKDSTIMLKTKDATIYFPVHTLNIIHVFGRIDMNKPFLNLIAPHKISIYFYTFYGQYIGAFIPDLKKAGNVLVDQVTAYTDAQKRLEISKAFIHAASTNVLMNIRYYKHYLTDFPEALKVLKAYIENISKAKDMHTLRSIEGRIRAYYYRQFDCIIKEKEFCFKKRTYHPPQNQTNALISLLNTLLYNTITALIHHSKMHVSIGFLHASNQRHASLNLDIAEIFKPIIVDRLVFRLINLKIIRPNHFDGIKLNEEGLKIVLKAFDERLNKVITINRKRRTYLHFIRKDVYTLQNHLTKHTHLKLFKKRDH